MTTVEITAMKSFAVRLSLCSGVVNSLRNLPGIKIPSLK